MKNSLFLMASFFIIISCSPKAQEEKQSIQEYIMPNTEVKYLTSKINDVDYKLYIAYPECYKDSKDKEYPVLYLLDADYSFAIAKNIAEHLSQRNHLKEIIIVGIAYNGPNKYRINRTRDYTPVNAKENVGFSEIQYNYSGGGPNFLSFMESELIPFIDSEYRTADFRVLTGHSYGGLFSSWTLMTKPKLFDGYVIVSPSLWYNNKMMFKIEDNLDQIHSTTKVYLTVGDREVNSRWDMPEDLKRFAKELKNRGIQKLEIKFEIGENETHNSIFPSAMSNGLRFVFDGV